jgi:tRNA (cytidine/uridine-2'-O-)-methyltransferase
MLNIVLFEPEIPPNTGNIIRLAANTGCQLHLIKPLGFPLDSAKMRRAGLDYHEFAQLHVHDNWAACCAALQGKRLFAITTKGTQPYHTVHYQAEDVLVFGPETRGLPHTVRNTFAPAQQLRLPMLPHSRSLNLSNAVAIVIYHAWQQLGFPNAE